MFNHSIHTASARSLAQLRTQLRNRLGVSCRDNFHLASIRIAHPTTQPQLRRLAMHEPAKPNPLHTSANEKVNHHRRLCSYARLMYAPSAVSTRIFSPSLIHGGTCTTRPVSVVAGLVTELAVADLIPGSVETTVISTAVGSSMP